MADCYLCGAYIPRGEGYRRNVQTGTSARFYMTRWGGAAISASQGLRTVCWRCATRIDALKHGSVGRGIMYLAALALSVVVGWNLIVSEYVWSGLFCLLGLPVLGLGLVIERFRQQDIDAKLARAFAELDEPDDEQEVRRSTESASEFVDRMLACCPALDRTVALAMGMRYPPKVGQSLTDWVHAWPIESLEDEIADPETEPFRADDTTASWAERVGAQIAHLSGGDAADLTAGLLSQAKYCRPRIDEPFGAYQQRFQRWFARVDKELDLSSIQSGIGDNEPARSWLDRTAPLYLTVDDGDYVEDVINKLEIIAADYPPRVGEPALAWVNRVKPAIDRANAK